MTWPSHWDSAKLASADLFSVESGIWKGKKPPFVECRILRNTNFTDDGTLDFANVAKIKIEQRLLSGKRLSPGDMIVERSGGGPHQPVGRVAYFNQPEGDFCFSNFTTRLRIIKPQRADSGFVHNFLFYFHMSGQTEALQRRTTGIRNLTFGDYLKLTVPLPPIGEQRAIVNALRAVQRAKYSLSRELELERERKTALMQYLFTRGTCGEPTKQTKIGEIPENWAVRRLDAVAKLVSGGTPSRTNADWWTGVIPWASPKDMKRLVLADTQEHLSEEGIDVGSRLVPAHTIFIVIRGMILAKRLPIALTQVPMAFNQDMKAVLPRSEYCSEFLLYALIWRKDELARHVGTSAHGTRRLSTLAIESLHVPVPPPDEQREIARLLGASATKIDALEREIPLHDELYRAMLEELMTGRLSASALIEEHQPR